MPLPLSCGCSSALTKSSNAHTDHPERAQGPSARGSARWRGAVSRPGWAARASSPGRGAEPHLNGRRRDLRVGQVVARAVELDLLELGLEVVIAAQQLGESGVLLDARGLLHVDDVAR